MRGVCALLLLVVPSLAHADEPDESAKPARPPPLPLLEPAPLPITRHIDVGLAVGMIQRVAEGQTDGSTAIVRYPWAVGVGLSARVDVWKYLRANLYAVRGSTTIDMAPDTLGFHDPSLGLHDDPGPASLTSYSFGLRLSPTLPLGPRARTWLSVGAGWGRLEVGRFEVASAGKSFLVRERAFSFVEIPVGIGTSIDIIKNWLSLEFEVTGAFHVAQRGTALRQGQAIDTEGHRVPMLALPMLSASFMQTLGLALVL